MIPFDPQVVGRRVGDTLLFYRINSLTTYLTQGGNNPAEYAESLLLSYQWRRDVVC
jgi:hypothetical protein